MNEKLQLRAQPLMPNQYYAPWAVCGMAWRALNCSKALTPPQANDFGLSGVALRVIPLCGPVESTAPWGVSLNVEYHEL